jgi:hypothetical protein
MGGHRVCKVRAQLIVVVAVEALRGRTPDGAVHSLDQPIGPRMVGLSQPAYDAVCIADYIEAHSPGDNRVRVRRLLCELDAIAGEHYVDLVGQRLGHVLHELPPCARISLLDELGPVNLLVRPMPTKR